MRTRARSRETSSPRKLQVASCKLFSLLKELCEACPAGGKWCLPPERFTPSTRTGGFHTNDDDDDDDDGDDDDDDDDDDGDGMVDV